MGRGVCNQRRKVSRRRITVGCDSGVRRLLAWRSDEVSSLWRVTIHCRGALVKFSEGSGRLTRLAPGAIVYILPSRPRPP